MIKKAAIIKLIVAALLLTFLLREREIGPAVADTPQGNDRFGLCFVSAAESLANGTRYSGALTSGAQWDRWPLYWHWVDEGGYVGTHDGSVPHDYDALVIAEIEHSLTPIAILLGTPDMRATGGSSSVPPPRVQDKVFPIPGQVTIQQGEVSTAASPPQGLFAPIFADGTDTPGPGKVINQANSWADFVANTVDRYKPGGTLATQQGWGSGVGVRHWEIWNEPDLNQFWSGTVAEYYRLLEVAYTTIKFYDPGATVILGGLAFFEKPDWLTDLLAQTGGDPAKAYFDVLSFHYYWSIYTTEYWLDQTRSTLDANGLSHVPIWITESGVPVWDDFPATYYGVPPDSPWRGTMEEQAAYVMQNAALAFYHGVERYYHFMLHDDCGNTPQDAFGLRQNFYPQGCNPPDTYPEGKRRPAYAAYQLAAEQMRDLLPLWREEGSGQDQIAFYRADDSSRVLALWATGGLTVTATISATAPTAQLYWIEQVPSGTSWGNTGITRTQTLTPTSGVYTLTLAPATNQNSGNPDDTEYYIGGRPYLLVEPDTLPPTSVVVSLPPTSTTPFAVQWSGQDWGSGIASYDVWFNEDGGPLRPWITATTAISATFTDAYSHTYGFAVRARDRAGNEEPIPTEPDAVTVVGPDTYPPTSSVEPLPPTSPESFEVGWSGEDLGSGIASYDVWFNDDGGPLQLWISATTATSASFSGVVSHTYGFAVRARDQVGNEEPIPSAPQASTQILAGVLLSGVVLGADGEVVEGAAVTFSGIQAAGVSTAGDGGIWSATVPGGEYAISTSADGHGTWPAPRYVTVSDSSSVTLTLAPLANAVTFGDFEDESVWTAWERQNGDISLSTAAFDGQAAAQLGSGVGWSITCSQNGQPGELWTLKQTVDVPSVTAPTLSFLHAISTTQTTFDYAWLEVVLLADGQPYYLVPWGGLWQPSGWALNVLDLSDWRGQTVDLLFQAANCSGHTFTAKLDRVSVGDTAAIELTERVYLPLVLR
jgi:hypothetical protein